MPVLGIEAKLECDRCGRRFRGNIDPATRIAPTTTPFDAVEQLLRARFFHDDDYDAGMHGPDVECGACTRERDDRNERPEIAG